MSKSGGLRDRYGLALSSESATATERYVEGLDRQLSLNAGVEDSFRAAIEADEGFALAHAGLAFSLFYQRKAAAARASAEQARSHLGGLSRRERQHVELVATFVGGSTARASELLREHLAEFPLDALAAQIGIMLTSGSGRVTRRKESLALLDGLAAAYGDDWWFLGSYAFAHHEVDRFEESRRLADRSLTLKPSNAAAAHPMAHVFFETNDHRSGVGFLEPWL